ncbi:MAG: DUF1573 domain-containing protein [Bacteroidetes bacterium]|jgi:hypothetical protein|nr:DUF1573 domain-containing protein [Bacteroidota bacterium]MBT4411942.1 DUF1573 domain-containing protein [Bacteroidota bacterium]MBT5426132.1 DUF1573 domain-containing protein [Bacteroidota bacterium]MBT7465715.1 DUF1573 domain-containing protein [Bacteroidota bacterium]
MKRASLNILSLIVVTVFITASVSAQQIAKDSKVKEEKGSSVNLSWDKAKHVFGSIEHKHAVTAKFTFTNTSEKPIVITRVGTTCGCTAPIFPKEPIKAGDQGIVSLRFDAVAPGFFKKAAKVHFSDGTFKELFIEGKVQVRMSDMKKIKQ